MAELFNTEIERFLNGDMKPEERRAFEERLQQEPELAKEVDFQQDLRKSITLFGDLQLKDTIHKAEKKAYEKGLLLTEHHINLYLDGELPEEEAEILEKRMKADQSFAQSVTLQQDLMESIQMVGDQQLKENIRLAGSNLQEKGFFEKGGAPIQDQPKSRHRARIFSLGNRRSLALAASFLLLLSVGFFLFQPSNQYSDLYDTHFKVDGRLRSERSEMLTQILSSVTDENQRNSLQESLEPYRDGEFKIAADLLTKHLNTFPQDEAARFYQGLSLMKGEKFGKAAGSFDKLLLLSDSFYQADALWFKGLCFLRMRGKKAEAVAIFEEISASETSPYARQAGVVLNALR